MRTKNAMEKREEARRGAERKGEEEIGEVVAEYTSGQLSRL